MKANCYKDDAAQIVRGFWENIDGAQNKNIRKQEDALKPVLDKMTSRVVESLSGEARSFYDREFTFFEEVTSISGKLKPYIKKTKAEKKVNQEL